MKQPLDALTGAVIGCAIEVHRTLGPGLLESTYEQCLARELDLNHIPFKLQVALPVEYKGIRLDCGYRMDLVVAGCLLLELKSVEQLRPIHQAQTLTYLRLSDMSTGLLINFNVERLKDGIKRFKM